MIFWKKDNGGYVVESPKGYAGVEPQFNGRRWSVSFGSNRQWHLDPSDEGYEPECESPWGILNGARALIYQNLVHEGGVEDSAVKRIVWRF